jgi:plastocyanin
MGSMEANSRTTLPTWALALVVPVVAAVVAVVTLTVTSDDSGTSGAAKNGTAVTIQNFAFSPTPLRVKAGTTVTVANQDHTAHTLTANDGAFDTGTIREGTHTTIAVGQPGTYAYHCEIHPFMTGRIEAT